MLERILVPLDGSVTAENVLPQVRRILHHHDSEIILVRAVVPAPVENGMMLATDGVAKAQAYLKRIEGMFSGASVRSVVRLGNAVGVILAVAEEDQATLIAMATHGQRGLKRSLMGSVAESVVRKTPVPVLAVRPFALREEEYRPIRNILVPLEKGGDIGPAEDLARLFDARLVLLRVLDDNPKKGVDLTREMIQADTELQRLEEGLECRGVEFFSLLQTGSAAEEILQAVRTHKIDLIAMSTHGRSGLARALKGSITEEVLRDAPVPMLIARISGKKAKRVSSRKESKLSPGSTLVS